MIVRTLTAAALPRASAVCMDAFMAAVAPGLTPEGIATFSRIASAEGFAERMLGDNLILVGESDGQIQGVVELKEGRHLAMLFVAPAAQNSGVGRRLFEAMLPAVRVATLTVSASLNAVPVYSRYGFVCNGEIAESAGLIYQPMTLTVAAPAPQALDTQ